jgi:hypothetical protein
MKTEASHMAQRADMSAAKHRTETAGSIFDYPKVVFLGYRSDGIHICREAEEMNGKNCFGLGSNAFLDSSRINVESLQIDVAKNDFSPEVFHNIGGGNPSERRNDRLVTGAEPKRSQRKMQGRGAGSDGNRMLGTRKFAPPLFELFDFWPLDEPTGAERL